jgi:2'-5' RNA ligase
MRLFTGISIPATISVPIARLIEKLRDVAALRWSPQENLHITTKFIGEWPDARLAELEGCLSKMATPEPFAVTVGHLGYLPNPHSPKVFFAGVQGGEALRELAAEAEKLLTGLGAKPESHPYTPHLTLARVPPVLPAVLALRQRIAQLVAEGETLEFGSFTVRAFHLYLSRNGAYTKLSTYPLDKAES